MSKQPSVAELEAIQDAMAEQMESIRTHHGEDYMDFVGFMLLVNQSVERMNAICLAATETESDEEMEEARLQFIAFNREVILLLMAKACSQISSKYGLESKDQLEGAITWSNSLLKDVESRLQAVKSE